MPNGERTPQDMLNDKMQTANYDIQERLYRIAGDIEAISIRLHKLEIAVARLEAIHKD